MVKPVKPTLEGFPMEYVKLLPGGSYSLKAMSEAILAFASEIGADPENVMISWDENWTGYEDCIVSLTLSVIETPAMFSLREKVYREACVVYEEALISWKAECAATEASNAEKNRLKKIAEREARITALQAEIEELRK